MTHPLRPHAPRTALYHALALSVLAPVALSAQAPQASSAELGVGLGISHQGAYRTTVGDNIGGHVQVSLTRWRSTWHGIRGDLSGHGFIGTGCDAACNPDGAGWIIVAAPAVVLRPSATSFPVYGMLGVGAYYGGESGGAGHLRGGAHAGVGWTMLRSPTAALAAEVRLHALTDRIAHTRYLLPVTVSFTW